MTTFHGIQTTKTTGAERDHLGDWRGEIVIDGDTFIVRPDGGGGALLNASGCPQTDHHDDGTRQLSADRDGVVSGAAGRVGQIVDGVYVPCEDWTRSDLGLQAVRS